MTRHHRLSRPCITSEDATDGDIMSATPQSFEEARAQSETGVFIVVIEDEDGNEIGTLDKPFENEFDASMAANDAAIPSVGIDAHTERVDRE